MTKPTPQEILEAQETAKRGGSCAPAPGSAIVYSGPHYGRTHRILKRTETLTWVEYHCDRFAVPNCDVEELDQSHNRGHGQPASSFDIDAVLDEHREMCLLLMQAVDAMRITQRLFALTDGHMLMTKCREIEYWLDSHQ